jgi:hypothetical protein
MGLNDPVSIDLTEREAVLILDTGEIKNEKPVLKRLRIPVNASATTQQVYDAVYALAEYTTYAVYDIEIQNMDSLDPID